MAGARAFSVSDARQDRARACTRDKATALRGAKGWSVLGCHRCGNREEESTSLADCALDPDATPMRLDDAFGDRKSEPGAETPGLG